MNSIVSKKGVKMIPEKSRTRQHKMRNQSQLNLSKDTISNVLSMKKSIKSHNPNTSRDKIGIKLYGLNQSRAEMANGNEKTAEDEGILCCYQGKVTLRKLNEDRLK